ncbi:MAG: polysaccharide biosynthesis protein, partial [Lachnospiraceae bacterium]|nr:polysaccharide biosynthesis protein [Lachnospiraceae bacterium]
MEQELRKKKIIEHWKVVALGLMSFDYIAMHLAYFLALYLRFDGKFSKIPYGYLNGYLVSIILYALVSIGIFWAFGMYKCVWSFVSFPEAIRFALGSAFSSAIYYFVMTFLVFRMPLSYHVFGAFFQMILVVAIRVSYRFLIYTKAFMAGRNDETYDRVMLIGAGSAGQMILRDIRNTDAVKEKVVCIIDDNPNKWGRFLDGVSIVGGRDDILKNIEKYHVNKIYLAIPSASASTKRDILNICKETDCELKSLPGMYQFVTDQVSVKAMKDVAIEDLLGREPIKADMQEVYKFINNKVVLVTGGGG